MAASAFQVLSQPTKTSNKTDSSKISFAQWNIISRCSSPGDSRIGVNGEMMIPSPRRSGLIESTNSRQQFGTSLTSLTFFPVRDSTSRIIPSRFLYVKISLIGPTFEQYRLIFLYKFKVSTKFSTKKWKEKSTPRLIISKHPIYWLLNVVTCLVTVCTVNSQSCFQ